MGCAGSKEEETPVPEPVKASEESPNKSPKKSPKKDSEKASNAEENGATTSNSSTEEKKDPSPVKSKKLASRLGRDLQTEEEKKAAKLFAAPKEEKSKLFQALNPESLAFESRREKEEKQEEAIQIRIRGGGADYARARTEDGEWASEEEEEEEDVDPSTLPDFGEFQGEMEELRKKRAKELEEKQLALKQKYEKSKAEEEARLAAELAEIKRKEDELAKKAATPVDDKFVASARQRVDVEAKEFMRSFSFRVGVGGKE